MSPWLGLQSCALLWNSSALCGTATHSWFVSGKQCLAHTPSREHCGKSIWHSLDLGWRCAKCKSSQGEKKKKRKRETGTRRILFDFGSMMHSVLLSEGLFCFLILGKIISSEPNLRILWCLEKAQKLLSWKFCFTLYPDCIKRVKLLPNKPPSSRPPSSLHSPQYHSDWLE